MDTPRLSWLVLTQLIFAKRVRERQKPLPDPTIQKFRHDQQGKQMIAYDGASELPVNRGIKPQSGVRHGPAAIAVVALGQKYSSAPMSN